MERKKIIELINKDELREAIRALIELHQDREEDASGIEGRLRALENKSLRGIISTDNYLLERSKIRSSILDLMNGKGVLDTTEVQVSKSSTNKYLIGAFGFILLLGLGYFLVPQLLNNNTSAKTTHLNPATNQSEIGNNQSPSETKKVINTPKQPTQKILDKITLGIDFELPPLFRNLSTKRNYAQFMAKLTRKYTWTTKTNAKFVEGKSIKLKYDEDSQTIKVKAPSIRLNSDIITSNKNASTVSNSLWINEEEKDGAFWRNVNQQSVNMLNGLLQSNTRHIDMYSEKIKTSIQADLKRLLQNSKVDYKSIDIQLDNLILPNGRKVPF